jgi:hypothetical protein
MWRLFFGRYLVVRNRFAWTEMPALTVALLTVGCAMPMCGGKASTQSQARTASVSAPDKSAARPPREDSPPTDSARPWHVELGFRNSYTKLAETRRLLDRRLEIPLKFDVFGVFNHPDTPLDRKTDLSLTSFYLAAGRQETDWLVWNLFVGGGGAKDHSHQRFLNANLEVDFRYALVYTGLTAEIYPWLVPRPPPCKRGARGGLSDRMDWSDRLSASRPYVVTGLETGYVSGEGRGHYSLAPFRVYADHEKVRDWITSYILGLGWAVPLDTRWSVNLTGDYRFHFYRPDEYDSWVVSAGLRYNF